MNRTIPFILGLDCGTNSVGWAVVQSEWNTGDLFPGTDAQYLGTGRIVGAGVRIFSEALDPKTEVPLNAKRREKRGQRKNFRQRAWRRDQLLAKLVAWEWMHNPPGDADAQSEFYHHLGGEADPYQLRVDALERPLSMLELSRVLMHLVKRRGFKSNRKGKSNADGPVLKAIEEIRKEMNASETRTLPEYLLKARDAGRIHTLRNRGHLEADLKAHNAAKKKNALLIAAPAPLRIFTHREMYEQEFDLIWTTQSAHHPEQMTEERRSQVRRCIYFQRPLRTQKHLIRDCPLVQGQKAVPMCYLQAQEARLWQTLNNLAIKNPDPHAGRKEYWIDLRPDQKLMLSEALQEKSKLTWDQVRAVLGLHSGEKFNIEAGKRHKELKGNTTVSTIRVALSSGKTRKGSAQPSNPWDSFTNRQRQQIVQRLHYEDDPGKFVRWAVNTLGLTPEQASRLSAVELEPGYFSYSVEALTKILPYLEKGLLMGASKRDRDGNVIRESAVEAAGYTTTKQIVTLPQLPLPTPTRNPVVDKALFQVRRIVNAVIRKYGMPQMIRLEMARDMKRNKEEREEVRKAQNTREKIRETHKTEIQQMLGRGIGYEPSRDEYLKYELWLECHQTCPYTLRPIGRDQLYAPEVQIEHIIPWSRCLDDTPGNKTLSFWHDNLCKGSRTPHEAYARSQPEHYEHMLQHIRCCSAQGLVEGIMMSPGKARRFEWTEGPYLIGDEMGNAKL
ncbi:MAG: type II CRISPR RNA-guided endonuclease Cas9, partial [Prosthecobacter sp.]|nr:type II CRISPR RNA-guided endonuclease Cas9 [Prosthecobacter sp.]